MEQRRILGRKPLSLLCSLILLAACGVGYYYVFQAHSQLKPLLPPLAAQRHLESWLEQTPADLMAKEPLFHLGLVTDIYRRSNYQLLWLDNYELNKAGKTLLQHLHETVADELIDYHYHQRYLQQRLHHLPARPKDATAVDILLTDAFIAYAEDVFNKKLLPQQLTQEQTSTAQPVGLNGLSRNHQHQSNHNHHPAIVSLLSDNTSVFALNTAISKLRPQHSAYEKLRHALAQYKTIAASGEWRPLTGKTTLKPHQRYEDIPHLRQLLHLYGDYPVPKKKASLFNWLSSDDENPVVEDPLLFDEELLASVKHFQRRHGLKDNGKVGKQTRKALNVSPSFRIKQIALNMKRWRQLPDELGERYIWVNLSNYHLNVIEDEKSIMDMRVIVGKQSRQTPEIFENINSIVLNPQWNVPRRIMVRDILPQVKKDPSYLTDRNIRIIDGWQNPLEIPFEQIDLTAGPLHRFPYRLQQDPGEDNALGVVKFVIPNDDSIYLHDTNNRSLFNEHYRALSSGCIRVEKPLQLAELLLQGKRGWHRNRIGDVLTEGKTTYVKLPKPIPTYLFYSTAWVDEDGYVQFRQDIYSEDAILNATARDAAI